MSFLQRLKNKGVKRDEDAPLSDTDKIVSQLYVDVYQDELMIVIYAQSAGADIKDVHVSIEGDANIVIIEGKQSRPHDTDFSEEVVEGSFVVKECVWGDFYRRIILPESVNINNAEAKIKSGVLILSLPLLKANKNEKVKLKVTSTRAEPKGKS